jgi:Cof subfamily protein (haloacid dehalogenase superfamily)
VPDALCAVPPAGLALRRFGGVVSDLDGTLLRSDGTLSVATLDMLEELRRRDVPFVVATARTPRAVQRIMGHRGLGLVVCANGAIVWNSGADEVVQEVCFPAADLADALARLRVAVPDVAVALLSARRRFLDEGYGALRAKAFGDDLPMAAAGEDGQRMVLVALRHPRLGAAELLAPVAAAFAGVGEASWSGASVVDVIPAGVTKAGPAASVLGYEPESAVVFGDMPNDLPLFAWGGWAVAVANAHPLVLEAADEVAPANDDDGVARTLGRMLF